MTRYGEQEDSQNHYQDSTTDEPSCLAHQTLRPNRCKIYTYRL